MEDDKKASNYNINLCRICQIPDQSELVNTSTTIYEGEETYLEILNFIFNDIHWVEDDYVSVACTTCLSKVTDIAEFKRLCLKTNSERGAILPTASENKQQIIVKDEETDHDSIDGLLDDLPNKEDEYSSSDYEPLQAKRTRKRKVVRLKRQKKQKRPTKEKTSKELKETEESADLLETNESEQGDAQPKKRKKRRLKSPNIEPKIIKCEICGEENFKNLRELERHIFRHNGTRNYICTTCGRKYITNGDLITHVKTHSEELKFKCDICGKMFKAIRNLQTHKAFVHMDKNDYKHLCTICGNKFVTAERLRAHVKRHNQIKMYPCDLCDKSFVSRGEVLRHAATHTNIRAFKCDLCDIEYKQKEFLTAHKSRKHGIGNYRPRLKQSEKPFQCRLCDAKFKCEVNIQPHLMKKHEINCDYKRDFDPTKYYVVLKPPQPVELDFTQ